jgi:hypothetical protein
VYARGWFGEGLEISQRPFYAPSSAYAKLPGRWSRMADEQGASGFELLKMLQPAGSSGLRFYFLAAAAAFL